MRHSQHFPGTWLSAVFVLGSGLVFSPCLPDAHAQSINTIAGGGPIGDGKVATSAALTYPSDVEIDADGNIYIADSGNARVRRVDAETGIVTTVAGGGTSGFWNGDRATETQLSKATGIALGNQGIYIADGPLVLFVDNQTGLIRVVAGGGYPADGLGDGGSATRARLRDVTDIVLDAAGNLFIADQGFPNPDGQCPGACRVRRVDAVTGIITTVAGNGEWDFSGDAGPATLARFIPSGIDLDTAGNIYIAASWPIHYLLRVDAVSGNLTVVAGTGEEENAGDGGPASEASLSHPHEVVLDSSGNIYVAVCCWVVRRIDGDTGIITRFAGHEGSTIPGDGGPAAEAGLALASGLGVDAQSNLFIADAENHLIRRVDVDTEIISTVAGGGAIGDGGPATSALLFGPRGLALDDSNDVLVADHGSRRIRKVSTDKGEITTVAGTGYADFQDYGVTASEANLPATRDIAVDSSGNLLISAGNSIYRVDAETERVTVYVDRDQILDGGSRLELAQGIALDGSDNLFIADYRVRRVDAETGIVTTVAGNGERGFSGDGGPATLAELNEPGDVAIDGAGNLYIADTFNERIRRVDAGSGIISTFAGGGDDYPGDGGPATRAVLSYPGSLDFDAEGDLYIGEQGIGGGLFSRVRRISMRTGIIETMAGGGGGPTGDGGRATRATLNGVRGVAIDAEGNLLISDTGNNRIRVVRACGEIETPLLTSPPSGTIDTSTAPTLSWSPSKRAFRYDVLLAREGDAGNVVASDLTATSFTPQNLQEGTTYFWRVRAKGDPFCDPTFATLSDIWSFRTIPPCEPPQPASLTSPRNAAVIEDFSTELVWTPVPRVSSYDVYLGTTSPPPLLRTTTGTSFTTPRLVAGNTYYWSVVAHAACDASLTSQSEIRSFFLAGPCSPAGTFTLDAPANGSVNVPTTTTLDWSPSGNATSYDLFLGTTNPPSIFLPDLQKTSLRISGLDADRTYFWQIKANIECDDAKSLTSGIASFTTGDRCQAPQGTAFVFTPPGDVGIGQTYALSWRDASGLDPGGTYVIERSFDSGFATILDSQELSTTTATFIADSSGVHHHRVRPVTRCSRAITGPNSATASVTVIDESPNVIFTVEPEAVINTPGRSLEDLRTRFAIENISSDPVSVILGRTEIASIPFFNIVDPLGGDAAFVTLQPRQPKTFEIRFSGPPNDVKAAYQGLVVATAAGSPIIPYAFVNLKVGDQSGAAPEFRVAGTPSEYTFFPGLDGDDIDRPPITVEIHNPGSTPMELGAEVGPEVWLEPEADWNDAPIPAGATRTVELFTRRNRALNGSAFPRYTWFSVRTRTGEMARLLVQDNDAASVGQGRTSSLESGVLSLLVPELVSETALSGTTLFSRVRLTNLGSDAVQAELVFTPSGTDGFSSSVQRAIVIVPPNDVATLTDPLVQVFGVTRPAAGQLEVRAAEEKIGLLKVESSVVSGDRADSSFVRVPTLRRGDGAHAGLVHQIAGITASPSQATRLVLAETSGTDSASLTLQLYDSSGSSLGQSSLTLPRYGHTRIDDLVTTLGGSTPFSAGRLTITITDGGGSVVALAKIEDSAREHASVLLSSPAVDSVNAGLAQRVIPRHGPDNGVSASLVAPYVASGTVDAGSTTEYATLMGFVAPFLTPLDFLVFFTDSSGRTFQKTVSVLGGAVVQFQNVIRDLFEINGPVTGSILIEVDPRGHVYSRLVTNGTPSGALDLASPVSELVTMVDSARPLYIDGLEQSTDPTRGARWNLYIRELAGRTGTVTVRLYEAGNRTHPIAVKHFTIEADARLAFETIFDAMELNTDERRKGRTNVLCMVTHGSGQAVFTAVALEIDNPTGTATSHTLQPASGLHASGATPTLVRVVDEPERKRPVRR